jgi:DNA-binding transcriptional ArsR family regulator
VFHKKWGIIPMARKEIKRLSETNGQVSQSGPEVSDQSVRELAQVFKLLSDETRLRILFYLALSPNGELHVTDLCQRLGQSQPAVSHHLALLRVSGLIESRREGKHNFYCVRTDHFGDLLLSLFSAAGEVPRNKKYRFHDFVLSYSGEWNGQKRVTETRSRKPPPTEREGFNLPPNGATQRILIYSGYVASSGSQLGDSHFAQASDLATPTLDMPFHTTRGLALLFVFSAKFLNWIGA